MRADGQYRGMMDQSKEVLKTYLNTNRDSLLFKLEGLSEYDARRPMTPTGTNLLGIVKHVSYVTLGYLGDVFNRPPGVNYPTSDDPLLADLVDLFATHDESISDIIELHHLASKTANDTIDALDLDSMGFVPWWQSGKQEVSLEKILVHVIAETAHHAGHADILRELIDGQTGMRSDDPNIPGFTSQQWDEYVSHLTSIAEEFNK